MVTTQKIANKINAELNSIAAEMNIAHEFKLMAHLGKGKDDNKIYGVLKVAGTKVKNTGGTTAGVISTKVTYVAEFVTPTAQDNYYATTIEQVVGALVDTQSGGHFTENGETVVWTIERGVPKDYALRDNVGSSIPIAFTINATISANGLLNGVKEWRLDGQLIPYSKEVIVLNKDGVTISIAEFSRQKSVMLAQMQEFRFTIPYDKTNTVCTTLQNDILNGDFRKTYTLSYSDGVVSFSRVVSLYRSGDMGTQDGDSTDINVSFVEAGASSYTEGADTVTYKLGLFTFPFGKNSDNTLYFDSQANQQTYMNTQVANASGEQVIKAPNLNNTLTVSTSFDAGLSSAGVYEIVNYNYAVLKREVTNAETMYLYYWVNNATIGADGMVMLELEQDTVQTIMFNPNLEIPDCMIERAHLNRWVEKVGDATRVTFDTQKDSPILLGEANIGDSGKTCTNRQPLKFRWVQDDENTNNINTWIYENVSYWVYAYVDTTNITYIIDTYNSSATIAGNDTAVSIKSMDGSSFKYPYGCFCYPVYRENSKRIKYRIEYTGVASTEHTIDETDFENFLNRNGGTSHIFCLKASIIPPFGDMKYFASYSSNVGNEPYIDEAGNLIFKSSNASSIENGAIKMTDINGDLCCKMTTSSTIDTAITLFTSPQQLRQWYRSFNNNNFTTPVYLKSEIINSLHNIEYNPKMQQKNFVEYKLKDNAGFSYTYDKSRALTQYGRAIFAYSEALQPEITRYYCRYLSGEQIYTEAMSLNYTGLAGSIDTTLSVAVDSYDNFIANNRNFWLQTLLGFGLNVAGGGIRSANPIAGLANAGLSLFDSAFALSDRLFTQSNLEQAPDSIRNTSGSILGNLQIAPMNIYLETWNSYDTTKQTADQYMNINGFLYNQLDSIVNHIHTRKYFNYIKAEIEDIQGVSVSNMIRENFKQRFSNGIRFWNYATFATNGVQYDKENYELWLED